MVTIVNSQPHASVIKQAICRHCGVTLEYVPADVTTRTVSDYGGGRDVEKSITCPKCRKRVYVS